MDFQKESILIFLNLDGQQQSALSVRKTRNDRKNLYGVLKRCIFATPTKVLMIAFDDGTSIQFSLSFY